MVSVYNFAWWLVDGAKRTENPLNLTINADTVIQAVYAQDYSTITYNGPVAVSIGGTTVNPGQAVQVLTGTQVQLIAPATYTV